MKALKEFMNTLDMGNFDFDKTTAVVDSNLMELTTKAAGVYEHDRCSEIVSYAAAHADSNKEFVKMVFSAAQFCKAQDVTGQSEVGLSEDRYNELLEAESKLDCLIGAGVDSWEGWDAAMEMFSEI
jgi:hypothetical protein